jgi:exosortase/archaeosortase family protein
MLDAKLKQVIYFAFLSASFIGIWIVIYENFIEAQTHLDHYVSVNLAEVSDLLLTFLGHQTFLEYSGYNQIIFSLHEDFQRGVSIGNRCNGIKLFGVFASIIIAFPKDHNHKLWYIPIGILILHIVNILRVSALTWIAKDHQNWLEFNHNVTFELIIYSVMFGLWWFWVDNFSIIKLYKTQD